MFGRHEYQDTVIELDKFMKKVGDLIPDEYSQDKHMFFVKVREINHWLRDISEVQDLKDNPPKIQIRKADEHPDQPAS